MEFCEYPRCQQNSTGRCTGFCKVRGTDATIADLHQATLDSMQKELQAVNALTAVMKSLESQRDKAVERADAAEDALKMALADKSAIGAVKVKPLGWFEVERGNNGYGKWNAEGYTVQKVEGLFLLSFDGEGRSIWRFPTADSAKAAAQADYEARILSALDIS